MLPVGNCGYEFIPMRVVTNLNCYSTSHKRRIFRGEPSVRDAYECASRTGAQCEHLILQSQLGANGGRAMIPKHAVDRLSNRLTRLKPILSFEIVFIAVFVTLVFFTGGAAAQAPVGGGGGNTSGWETILDNLYNVLYITLQYAGLTILVLGFIVWLSARNNSQRSETGMKLTMGGAAMVVAYFGLGALVSLLEFIAG